MAKGLRELSSVARAAVVRLRLAAKSLDGVDETTSFGNPTFKVGRQSIAVVDRYDGRECLWLRVPPIERESLLKQPGWFPSPYDPKRVALCCSLEHFDWRGLKRRLRQSYELAQS
jgi:predicted DNA-binding protein (MmcQ/YjbR family)